MPAKRLLGILVSLFGLRFLRPFADRFEDTDVRNHATKWVPALLIVAYVYLVEDRDAASLGVRWDGPRPFLRRVAVGLAAMLGSNVVLGPIHERIGTDGLDTGMAEFTDLGVGERLFVALTAGVTEEVLFRGYALERLDELTDNRLLAGVVTLVAFVLGHKSDTWDWGSLVFIVQPATIVTALYLRFRDLLALITIHALTDAVGLLLAERFIDDE